MRGGGSLIARSPSLVGCKAHDKESNNRHGELSQVAISNNVCMDVIGAIGRLVDEVPDEVNENTIDIASDFLDF